MDGNRNFQDKTQYLWENESKTARSLSGKEVKTKYEQSVLQGPCLLTVFREQMCHQNKTKKFTNVFRSKAG